MPYSAEISRANPTCFLFLIDQSKSMNGPLGRGEGKTKAREVADAVNGLMYKLVLRCVRGKEVLDRFHVGVLGYGAKVGPAFGGGLAGRGMVPISELGKSPLRVESRTVKLEKAGKTTEQTIRVPIWFEPHADGKTPMTAAFELAWGILSNFLDEHPACYPPMVVNITDGEASDGDPEGPAGRLRALASADGELLLFNLHLSSRADAPVEFPENESALPDDFSKRLFRMSSFLPAPMHAAAGQAGLWISSQTRGFVFNADLAAVIRFLDIGTRVDPEKLAVSGMPGLVQGYRELQLPRGGCRTDECEDAAAGDPARGRFAVADGAGESFSPGPWARLLVEEFVETGLAPDWAERLPALQKRWAEAALQPGEEPGKLPWYQENQFYEGAFATFLGLVLQANGPSSIHWHAVAVGDTCLFHVRGNQLLEAFPVAQSADFGNAPWLVGSRTEPARIDRRDGEARPGDRFWLMTDALAAWFLRRAEDGERPWARLDELVQRPDVETAFRRWVTALRRKRRLRDDDVTLLAVSL